MRHPCLVLFIAFGAGILTGLASDVPPWWLLGVGATAWLLLAIVSCRSKGLRGVCLVLLVSLAGVIRGGMADRAISRQDLSRFEDRDGTVVVEGVVSEAIEAAENGGRFGLRIQRIEVGDTVYARRGGVLIRCKDFVPRLSPGDRVRATVKLRTPTGDRNPGGFDYRGYLRGRGYTRTGTVRARDDLEVIRSEASLLDALVVTPLRRHVREAIRQNLSGDPAALVEGVLLGDKSGVSDPVREAFSRSGVSHVLAVSGLHVGLVAGGAFFLARSVGGGAVVCGVSTSIVVWVYALITGLPASVVRAASVACLVVWARACRVQISALNALGLAGLLILVFRPFDLLSLGFQLSFAATGGILLLYRPITDLLAFGGGYRWRTWVAMPLSVSVAAQLSTMPLIVAAFGQVSVIATLANLVVVPLMSGAVGIGLLTVVAAGVSVDLAAILNGANWAALSASLWLAHRLAAPEWAAVSVVAPSLSSTVVFVCALLILVESVRASRWCSTLVIVGLVAANVSVWRTVIPEDRLIVRVIDVGQGDAILLSFPNGRQMLVDGGIAGFGQDAGDRAILPLLRYLGISRLDAVVASHPHADHVGGLVTILDRVEVGHYLESGQYYGSATAGRIQDLIARRGMGQHVVAAGDTLVGFGAASVVVLHPRPEFVNPDGPAPDGLNNGSVVFKVTYRGQSVLLTGDIEHETDPALLSWGGRLASTILKSAHHGSKTSSTSAFLNVVKPEWVAISCGIDNKFKHPSPEVLERYAQQNADVRRTDLSGCVTYEIDGQGVKVRGHLEEGR